MDDGSGLASYGGADMSELPVLFVSHGAATLTMDPTQPTHHRLLELGAMVRAWRPRSILVISAHDVRSTLTVAASPVISMIQDHPAASGHRWSAPGDVALAKQAKAYLALAGLGVQDGEPELDHGAWAPLSLLFPQGQVPLATLSLASSFEPRHHLRAGAALTPLREQGVLILASGGLTHNQRVFRQGYFSGVPSDQQVQPFSERFDAWVKAQLELPAAARQASLLEAQAHPDFAQAHPSLDHWLPLIVALGAAGDAPSRLLVGGFQHSLSMSAFSFGAPT